MITAVVVGAVTGLVLTAAVAYVVLTFVDDIDTLAL